MNAPKLKKPLVFAWDIHNREKIQKKHNVNYQEAEQKFLNKPLYIAYDARHSESETRFSALGKTDLGKLLSVIFTVRADIIRIISARNMSRKERQFYAQAVKN